MLWGWSLNNSYPWWFIHAQKLDTSTATFHHLKENASSYSIVPSLKVRVAALALAHKAWDLGQIEQVCIKNLSLTFFPKCFCSATNGKLLSFQCYVCHTETGTEIQVDVTVSSLAGKAGEWALKALLQWYTNKMRCCGHDVEQSERGGWTNRPWLCDLMQQSWSSSPQENAVLFPTVTLWILKQLVQMQWDCSSPPQEALQESLDT